MKTTIDRAGRLVVPKAMRARLRLESGGAVEVTEHDGVIEVRPVATDVHVVQTPEGPVAEPTVELPRLTDDIVRETIEHTRR